MAFETGNVEGYNTVFLRKLKFFFTERCTDLFDLFVCFELAGYIIDRHDIFDNLCAAAFYGAGIKHVYTVSAVILLIDNSASSLRAQTVDLEKTSAVHKLKCRDKISLMVKRAVSVVLLCKVMGNINHIAFFHYGRIFM